MRTQHDDRIIDGRHQHGSPAHGTAGTGTGTHGSHGGHGGHGWMMIA
jgi:hypothetical protein